MEELRLLSVFAFVTPKRLSRLVLTQPIAWPQWGYEFYVRVLFINVLHIPVVHAHDVSKQIPREKSFSPRFFYFGILLLKNWLTLRRQLKLNMESCEPADEEELPTFSLGMEFLTPQKERKEDKILDKRILYSIRK